MARRDVVATRLDRVDRLLLEAAAEKAGISKSQFLRATALTAVDALLRDEGKEDDAFSQRRGPRKEAR